MAKQPMRNTIKKAKGSKAPVDKPARKGQQLAPLQMGPNSKAQMGQIKSIFRRLQDIEERRALSNKAFSKERSDIVNKEVKGDLGMQMEDFNLSYRLHKLSGEKLNSCLSTMRLCFNAIGLGEMVNFVEVLEQQNTTKMEGDGTSEGDAPPPGQLN